MNEGDSTESMRHDASLLISPVHCAALARGDSGSGGGERAAARLDAGRVGAGASGGAVAAARYAPRIPVGGHGLAGHDVRAPPERHPRGRDGPRQDDPDDRAARAPGVRAPGLGPAPDHCAHVGAAQLGDGVQEVVSRLQATHILRRAQGAPRQAPGLDQDQRLPRLHHFLQARHPGPHCLPPQEVEISRSRRGALKRRFS